MTRRRLLLALGAALAVLVAAGAVWWATQPRPGVTEANCAQIKPGMRLDEVEAILGGPPQGWSETGGSLWTPRNDRASWVGSQGRVLVYLKKDGTVIHAYYLRRPSLSERVIGFLQQHQPWTR